MGKAYLAEKGAILVDRRRRGKYALSSFRHLGAARKVQLSAGTRELPEPDGFAGNLSHDINPHDTVERDHFVVLCDHAWIGNPFDGFAQDLFAFLDEIIHVLGSLRKSDNRISWIERFL